MIELQHVTKDYGKGKGVFDLSFSVPQGEVFGYLGPNGAGKTTTIRQLMGFIRPDKGSCRMIGKECFRQAFEIQKKTGYLAGELAFPEDMTGLGFLKFMAEMKGMKNVSRMKDLMERFELNPHGKIKRMSRGMKQKVGIVNTFMHDPEEPVEKYHGCNVGAGKYLHLHFRSDIFSQVIHAPIPLSAIPEIPSHTFWK